MTDLPTPQSAEQPLVAEKPPFFQDLRNGASGILSFALTGLLNLLKIIWTVPGAQGALTTWINRYVIGGIGATVIVAIIDKVAT